LDSDTVTEENRALAKERFDKSEVEELTNLLSKAEHDAKEWETKYLAKEQEYTQSQTLLQSLQAEISKYPVKRCRLLLHITLATVKTPLTRG
jgi:hypothetical protein